MTLYTTMPLELVLNGADRERTPYWETTIGGIVLQLEPVDEFHARIVRIVSSDLNDYLNPAYMPGSLIAFGPRIR